MRLLSLTFGLAVLYGLLSCVEAASIEGRLVGATFRGRVVQAVPTKTKVLLNGGLYQTHVYEDGSFVFPGVPVGTYMLEVHSPQMAFSKVRISVTANDVRATRVSLGDHFTGHQQLLPMPLTLRPRPRPMHYVPPECIKVAGWFANPMLLMSSFSLLMLLLMPKIIANLDDDASHALRPSHDFSLRSRSSQQSSSMLHYALQHRPQMIDGTLDRHPSSLFQSFCDADNVHQPHQALQQHPIPVQSKKQK